MRRSYRYDVFVSYRWVSPDREWVREQLEPALTRSGLSVCLDVNDFVPGRDLMLEMTRAETESARALCVVSPDYFEEGRMVGFEALMARRRDPMGAESRLIPLILRPTDLAEWIRGLVPVDWTDGRRVTREWRKLLTILGAPDTSVAPPGLVGSDPTGVQRLDSPLPLTLVSVAKLLPRDGSGFGYDVVVRNDGDEDVFVREVELGGELVMPIQGAGASVERVSYDIVLDSSLGDKTLDGIAGTVYPTADADFGMECTGGLTYELNTEAKEEWWRYTVSVPVYVRVSRGDRAIMSLRFRRNVWSLAQRAAQGDSPGLHRAGTPIRDKHSLTATFEGGATLFRDIDRGFLDFLLQRKDLGDSRNLPQLIGTAVRDAEEEREQATRAARADGVDFLEKSIKSYRRAEYFTTLLPREWQENLHMIRRAIRDLEQQISGARHR